MPKKKSLLFIALLLLIVAGGFKLARIGIAKSVIVTEAVVGTAVDAVPAVVSIRSDFTLTLSSEESGRVIESALVLGTRIQEGELVLELDPTDLEIEIEALKAQIETAQAKEALKAAEEAALQSRKEDLENLERLFAAGTYPELEMKRQRRAFEVFREGQIAAELSEAQNLANLGRLEAIGTSTGKNQSLCPHRRARHSNLCLSRRTHSGRNLVGRGFQPSGRRRSQN